MISRFFRFFIPLLLAVISPIGVQSQTVVSPPLTAGSTAGWYTDRYAPASFAVNNGVHGRNDVLQIGVNSTTDAANRLPGQQSTFYNTTGKKYDVNTLGSWSFSFDLFVESSWMNSANGYVRTDLWATATDNPATSNPSAYPVVGFTNYGGAARFRGYDVNTGNWMDFGNGINVAGWNTLGMGFDLATNTFSYYVNGALAGSVLATDPSTGVGNVMVQAYNFNDPALQISNNPAYTANWSNTSTVPEPSTYLLMASGLAVLGVVARRRQRPAPQVVS